MSIMLWLLRMPPPMDGRVLITLLFARLLLSGGRLFLLAARLSLGEEAFEADALKLESAAEPYS